MTMSQHTINGVPLSACTQDDLYREYMAGMQIEADTGLSAEQEAKLLAIEKLLKPTDGEEKNDG